MKKILITGGAGRVGKPVTEQFVLKGWDVKVIGLEKDVTLDGAEYAHCDILNYEELQEHMCGCQAVVHLAAIAHPMQTPGPTLFQANTSGTYNVFQAAADEGIRRVVQASSINAFGCFWGITETQPDYFPLTEDHPTNTTDPYSYSKAVAEDIGAYFWRRAGISSVAFRLPAVWNASHTGTEEFIKRQKDTHAELDEFRTLSDAAQEDRIARLHKEVIEYRSQLMFEYPQTVNGFQLEEIKKSLADEPLWSHYLFDRFNFWTYIHELDVGLAVEQAVNHEYEGSHPLFISARNNSLNYRTLDLIRVFFPEVYRVRRIFDDTTPLVSIRRAEALINYFSSFTLCEDPDKPRFGWPW